MSVAIDKLSPALTKSRYAWCAALLLGGGPGCVLVGYNAEGDLPGLPDAQQRNVLPKDAGLAQSDGGVARPSDATLAVPDTGSVDAGPLHAALGVKLAGCGVLGSCTPSCESGSCRVPCANSQFCWTTCHEDTTCAIDCSNGGICDMNCREGASCEVDCRGTTDCDYLECEEGASCVLHCANNPLGCSLRCHGVAMSCANNVYVCDAPCPG
jgi:hypothetical protein